MPTCHREKKKTTVWTNTFCSNGNGHQKIANTKNLEAIDGGRVLVNCIMQTCQQVSIASKAVLSAGSKIARQFCQCAGQLVQRLEGSPDQKLSELSSGLLKISSGLVKF